MNCSSATHFEIWRHRHDDGYAGDEEPDEMVERFGPEADLDGVEHRAAVYSDYAEELYRRNITLVLYNYYVKEVVTE